MWSNFVNMSLGLGACKSNPCGRNAVCQDSIDGNYACVCQEGFSGDPFKGCQGKTVITYFFLFNELVYLSIEKSFWFPSWRNLMNANAKFFCRFLMDWQRPSTYYVTSLGVRINVFVTELDKHWKRDNLKTRVRKTCLWRH